ncbi:15910_t:CDS:2 [Cetraspora pellucida]|uniref:15910_t:CDS:1 n=1 Tax=Cetraspora pellucida TaxID=1433469 RepID=A0A9N9B729_9GLOM|nr:15910_t:CDS:2 [Cetraspora pellucida]
MDNTKLNDSDPYSIRGSHPILRGQWITLEFSIIIKTYYTDSTKVEYRDLENQRIQNIQGLEDILNSEEIQDSEKINVFTNRLATLKNRLDVLEDLLKTFYLDTSFLDHVKKVRKEIVNEKG